ncbi:putative choline/ethanolamine kinase [Neospora caninum Liverpool]|uniref:Choline/ethanolamine kinase, putative n=1 Tax=Neospora caninum (strain Liverpool) TaxID=572307 RepID=F0VBG4_NEOCL|nr:putative choline/ethanolamine kinase [Neospora caninum Liverpool]CBZ50948.1 putative choline/ethanolamine kinase [Neospora caninum Liverpool]CEL68249.1 TPA: choline/ethanolamine kinase, putative [Neospora caninum Liverpool]|eukprot:XP_003880981.1 putative choline/ethanolamine kinase [Neospora caninum Liverpool]
MAGPADSPGVSAVPRGARGLPDRCQQVEAFLENGATGHTKAASLDLSVLTNPPCCTGSPEAEQQALRRLEVVRALARSCVREWRDLPPHKVTAKPLSGGLSNTLFVVDASLSERETRRAERGRDSASEDGGGDRGGRTGRCAKPQAANGEAADPSRESGKERTRGARAPQDKQETTVRSDEGDSFQGLHAVGKPVKSVGVSEDVLSHKKHGAAKENGTVREVSEAGAKDQKEKCPRPEQEGTVLAETPNRVLLRVYGHSAGTELFDPKVEQRLFKKLGEIGIAPRCLAEFEGGRVEAWLDGHPLQTAELYKEDIQAKVATVLARFHQTRLHLTRQCVSEPARRACLWCSAIPSAACSPQLTPVPLASPPSPTCPHDKTRASAPPFSRPSSLQLASATSALSASGSRSSGEAPVWPLAACDFSEPPREKRSPPFLVGPCECVLCRTQMWLSLAEKAERTAKALARQSSFPTGKPRSDIAAACLGREADRADREDEHEAAGTEGTSRSQGRDEKATVGGGEVGDKIPGALDDVKKTAELMETVALEKYRRKAKKVKKAILGLVAKELSPESLRNVYGSAERWALLSAAAPVLSHNDLQENNMMLTEDGQMHLIDFEYANENLRGFDVANLFCEFAIDYTSLKRFPFFSIDPSKYPSGAARRAFIRLYLQKVLSLAKVNTTPREEFSQTVRDDATNPRSEDDRTSAEGARTEAETGPGGEDETHELEISDVIITNFDNLVMLLTLSSHLIWAFWSVIKAPMKQSDSDFSYLQYAAERLKMYDDKEEELVRLGLFSSDADTQESHLHAKNG